MDNKVLSIKELKEMATPVVRIPNFDGTGYINVKMRKPRIMDLAMRGEIPNHLIGVATAMTTGKSSKKDKKEEDTLLKDAASIIELYASVCLVEPKYEEFKEIMTDAQGDFIFQWAMGQVTGLDDFRTDKADGKPNTDGTPVQDEAK